MAPKKPSSEVSITICQTLSRNFVSLVKKFLTHYNLQVQYRMHPCASEFPSKNFYEGTLQILVTINERPEIFSFLAQQLQSADLLASHRVFLVLFRTLKELSTKQFAADQKKFFELFKDNVGSNGSDANLSNDFEQ